jgi:hypothetical protein
MTLEFPLTDFLRKKISNVTFLDNPSNGNRTVPGGRTDRRTDLHEEANSRFSQFVERA